MYDQARGPRKRAWLCEDNKPFQETKKGLKSAQLPRDCQLYVKTHYCMKPAHNKARRNLHDIRRNQAELFEDFFFSGTYLFSQGYW